jgi:hypothetical protein
MDITINYMMKGEGGTQAVSVDNYGGQMVQ